MNFKRFRCERAVSTVAFVGLAVLLAWVAWTPAITAQQGDGLERVVMQLDWTPNTNHTGIYVALNKGWYADEGIDLVVRTPGGDFNVEALVASGNAHFGIGFQEYMTSARTEGVPLVSIGAIVQHNSSGFASISRGIHTVADMAGKRYGGNGLPIEQAVLDGLLQSEGYSIDDVTLVGIPSGTDLIILLQRNIDFAWIYYGWQGIEAELRGIDLDIVMMDEYFDAVPDYYTPLLMTSETLIEANPDLVARFMRATSRGYTHAASNPDEAADIFMQYVPEADAELVRASQRWLSPRYIDDAPYFGYQSADVWQRFADWMWENDLIQQPLNASDAFTNDFLP